MQHGELRTDRCLWFIDRLFKLSYTYISNISTEGSRTSPRQQEVRVQVALRGIRRDPSREPEENQNLIF